MNATPLIDRHISLGARLVPFSGWNMPVQYSGILEEHRAVRTRAGLFDVSHMGRFVVSGAALESLEHLTSNRVSALSVGKVQYSSLPLATGCPLDDILVAHTGEDRWDLIVNAGNLEADRKWITSHLPAHVDFRDESSSHGILALQGPLASQLLARLAPDLDLAAPAYTCQWVELLGTRTLISRTGYTGEDGFELYPSNEEIVAVWDALLETGSPLGLLPCGLGCRDTLRLEAGYSLYGHELNDSTSLLESGLGWITDLTKEFIGAETLRRQRDLSVPRTIIGLRMTGRALPRQDYPVLVDGRVIGKITSGTQSPTLGHGIAMALIENGVKAGTACEIEIRGRLEPAAVVSRRFYRR